MVRKCPHCGKKVGQLAVTCWKCKKRLDGYEEAPLQTDPWEIYTPDREPHRRSTKPLKLVLIIGIVCIVIFLLFIIINNLEMKEDVSYDSYVEFMEDRDETKNFVRASPGDTVKVYDTISYISYDYGDDLTWFQFESFNSQEGIEKGYRYRFIAYSGNLASKYSISQGSDIILFYKIEESPFGGEDWDFLRIEHQ